MRGGTGKDAVNRRLVATVVALVMACVVIGSGAPVSAAPPDVFVFGRGADNAIWYRARQDRVWGPWRSIGGIATEAPTVVSYPDGRLGVFVRGADGALWLNESADGVSWRGWGSLGGLVGGTAVAARDRIGPTDAFDVYVVARGADNRAWLRRYGSDTGTWSRWSGPFGGPTDGTFVAAPSGFSATAYSVGRDRMVHALELTLDGGSATERTVLGPVGDDRLALLRDFIGARALNGELVRHDLVLDETQAMGGRLIGGPTPGRGDAEIFYAVGLDRALWAVDCCAQGWRSLGGILLDPPSALQATGGDVVAARGADSAVWIRGSAPSSSQLGPWATLGGILKDRPVVVAGSG